MTIVCQPSFNKKSTWIDQIRPKQLQDESLVQRLGKIGTESEAEFGLNSDRVICFKDRVCMPKDLELRLSILQEAHISQFAMHPGENRCIETYERCIDGMG